MGPMCQVVITALSWDGLKDSVTANVCSTLFGVGLLAVTATIFGPVGTHVAYVYIFHMSCKEKHTHMLNKRSKWANN